MTTDVKICGLTEPKTLQAAIDAGARYIGLVFYPPSPRHVDINIAYDLARMIPTGVRCVGLFVDPTNEQLERVTSKIQLDRIQLHGSESPERISDIKSKHLTPIIKAIPVRDETDLQDIHTYEAVSDMLLFDTKHENQHGGTGVSFDWTLLKNKTFTKPWMLSGGLNTGNIQAALSTLRPNAVDISSGVEKEKGTKDPTLIKEFIDKVKSIS